MNKRRSLFYALAGAYLIYLAYELAIGISTQTGKEQIVSVIGAIVFGGIGIFLIVQSIVKGYKISKEEKQQSLEQEDDTLEESVEEREED